MIAAKDLGAHVGVGPNGLVFHGRDLGRCHVHVAYKDDPENAARAA